MNGADVRAIRASMRVSQTLLGERLGVTQERLSQIENSTSDLDRMTAAAVEMAALRSGWLPALDQLIGVGRLVNASGTVSRREALAVLALEMGGCRPFEAEDHAIVRDAARIRSRYLADQLCELYDEEAHDIDTASTLALIRIVAEHTDATFWVATQYHHLLYRGQHEYLTGRRNLADELPEIVSAVPFEVYDPDEPLVLERGWDLTVKGFGRDREGGHVQTRRVNTASEPLARALVYAGHFMDIAQDRAGD